MLVLSTVHVESESERSTSETHRPTGLGAGIYLPSIPLPDKEATPSVPGCLKHDTG